MARCQGCSYHVSQVRKCRGRISELEAQINTMRDDYEEQAGEIVGLTADNEAMKKKLWASGVDKWDDE